MNWLIENDRKMKEETIYTGQGISSIICIHNYAGGMGEAYKNILSAHSRGIKQMEWGFKA